MKKDNGNRRKSAGNEAEPKVQDGVSKDSFNPQEVQRRGVVVTDDIPNSDEDDENQVKEESGKTKTATDDSDKMATSPEVVLVEKDKRPEWPTK